MCLIGCRSRFFSGHDLLGGKGEGGGKGEY